MSLPCRCLALTGLIFGVASAQDASWDTHSDCPQPRFEGPSLVIDGQLYAFGGFRNAATQVTTKVDVYDPVLDAWTGSGDLPTAVTHFGVELDDRTVWLVGGFVGDHPGVATDEVWSYDLDLGAWSSGPPLPKLVAGGALVRYDRSLHWFGGVEADRDTASPDHFALDLDDTGSGWSPLAPLPQARNHLSAVRLGGWLHAIGGQFGHDTGPTDTNLHHAYSPVTDTWLSRAPLPLPRSHFESGTMVHAGKAILLGGRSNVTGETALIDVTEYDPAVDEWRALPPLPEPRLGMAAKVIQGRLLAACGADHALGATTQTISRPIDLSFEGHMRVNCGGPHYVDTAGRDWWSDLGHREGSTFEGDPSLDIGGTQEDPLYLTHRAADDFSPTMIRYRIPADDGKYRLVLHFAEIQQAAPEQRELRIVVEGETVRGKLDVAEEVGQAAATTATFDFEATQGAIYFLVIATAGAPMLSAYELITLSEDAFGSYCSSGPNSTGAAAEIYFNGSSSLTAGYLRFLATPVPADQFGLFFYSEAETDVTFGNGRRCIDHPIYRLPAVQSTGDTLAYKVKFSNLPNGGDIFSGSTWSFQAWFRDPPAGGAMFDTSDALRMTFTN